jgi:hypothetical protein
MSREQRRDFTLPTLPLSIGLFASVALALVTSTVLLVVQLRIERARIGREARFAKARRLRYKADGTEVMVPNIMPPLVGDEATVRFFHIFLSHVWGYAWAGGGRAWRFERR